MWAHAASGQFSSGSTGALGAFDPTQNQTHNVVVTPGGVYNYTTVNIRPNTTVRYFRNNNNDPVVILATGNVTIDGTIIVSGFNGSFNSAAPEPGGAGGPGGFNGGFGGAVGFPGTAGHGPGGGASGTTAGNAAVGGVYGAPTLFTGLIPLFGGSGGGGGGVGGTNVTGSSGGGGGGAILIASSTRITVNGTIRANGGNQQANGSGGPGCSSQGAPGSGGGIRLVAPEIAGGGQNSILQAVPGLTLSGGPCATPGGPGRIRLEASTNTFAGFADPTPSPATAPGPVSPNGNPALANVPTLSIASVGGSAVPATPTASYSVPDITLAPGTANPVPVVINATNTPVGSPTEIKVRLIPRGTASTVTVPALDHTGTFAASSATASVTLPAGQVTVIQVSAAMTLTGQFASLFPLIDGEPVERVMVAANMGEASSVSLVTKSGREVPLEQLPLEDRIRVAQAWEAMKNTRTE
jgi:hypothetical protein